MISQIWNSSAPMPSMNTASMLSIICDRDEMRVDIRKVARPEDADAAVSLIDEQYQIEVHKATSRPWMPPSWHDIARTVYRGLVVGRSLEEIKLHVENSSQFYEARQRAVSIGIA